VTEPVALLQLVLTASSMEAITVSGLRLGASGTGDDTSVTGFRLYEDVDGNGLVTAVDFMLTSTTVITGDNGSISFSGFVLPVPASGRVTLIVAYMIGAAKTGTYSLTINSAADVTAAGNASGEPIVATGLPMTGNALTVVAGTPITPVFFMGGCGAAGFGGPMPWAAPLLALAAAIALMRRSSKAR
jgi:hypothetical protein